MKDLVSLIQCFMPWASELVDKEALQRVVELERVFIGQTDRKKEGAQVMCCLVEAGHSPSMEQRKFWEQLG